MGPQSYCPLKDAERTQPPTLENSDEALQQLQQTLTESVEVEELSEVNNSRDVKRIARFSSENHRWLWSRMMVSTLILAACGALFFACRLGRGEIGVDMKTTADLKSSIEDWEQIPGIDDVIAHAKTLELKQPLRRLDDLFYDSQPTEKPWIRTECVIDVVQAAAYLGQAVVFLYKAIDYPGLKCPDDSPVGCAASVAGFITSVTWIASYLSFAASACASAVKPEALCAGDWTALMANFGEMATVGAAVKEDCDFGKDWLHILNITGDNGVYPPPHMYWLHFVPKLESSKASTLIKWDNFNTVQRNRNFDITQCVMDVTNSASYIVRAILQIRSAALACPQPRACAINIMNIISSFAWISQFTALAVSDCSKIGNQKALCTADISDMVAAVTNGPAAGVATTSDCADLPVPEDEIHHLPMDR